MRIPALVLPVVLLAASCAPATGDASGAGGSAEAPDGAAGASDGAAWKDSGPPDASADAEAGLSRLDQVLAALRADPQQGMRLYSVDDGWPLQVAGGYLFVSTDPALTRVAGDHDGWAGTAMHQDAGFSWVVLAVPKGDHYKFTDGTTYKADPWSRSYSYDTNGEMSLVLPAPPHLDRYFQIGDAAMQARTVRVYVPAPPVTHELYAEDGQNLFDPAAPWGGWKLEDSLPPGMLVIGIDNTPARMDEYTQVPDVISGQTVGGQADAYADFLESTLRPLIRKHYGEPGPVGLMGSSLGGLVSLEIAYRYPKQFRFAASLSGTVGWGSIDPATHNQTIIERYRDAGHQAPVLYVDSGGSGSCVDSDGDGIFDDDPNASDNYCENQQMHATLLSVGYTDGQDVFYYWQSGAQHNEAAWAARVYRPLQVFAGL